MKSHTHENSIRVLKKLRDAYQGQLDASVIVELESVIAALENEKTRCSCNTPSDLGKRTLDVIAQVLRIVTDISDLMK